VKKSVGSIKIKII